MKTSSNSLPTPRGAATNDANVRDSQAYVAKPLAPEDICVRDRVVILREYCELPSFLWDADPTTLPIEKVVRIAKIPDPVEPPMKVKRVCLPFVFAKTWKGETRLLDVRLACLARVDRRFAKAVWRSLRGVSQNASTVDSI